MDTANKICTAQGSWDVRMSGKNYKEENYNYLFIIY